VAVEHGVEVVVAGERVAPLRERRGADPVHGEQRIVLRRPHPLAGPARQARVQVHRLAVGEELERLHAERLRPRLVQRLVLQRHDPPLLQPLDDGPDGALLRRVVDGAGAEHGEVAVAAPAVAGEQRLALLQRPGRLGEHLRAQQVGGEVPAHQQQVVFGIGQRHGRRDPLRPAEADVLAVPLPALLQLQAVGALQVVQQPQHRLLGAAELPRQLTQGVLVPREQQLHEQGDDLLAVAAMRILLRSHGTPCMCRLTSATRRAGHAGLRSLRILVFSFFLVFQIAD